MKFLAVLAAPVLRLVRVSLTAGQSARRPWQWKQGFGVCVHLCLFRFGTAPVLTCSFGHIRCLLSGPFVWLFSSHLPSTMGRWTQYDEVRKA